MVQASGGSWAVIKSLRGSRDGLRAAVRRLHSGIFSPASGLRSLPAEARYLLGKRRRKNPGNALRRASLRRGGARKNRPRVFIHFLSFAGLNSTRKRPKGRRTPTRSRSAARQSGWRLSPRPAQPKPRPLACPPASSMGVAQSDGQFKFGILKRANWSRCYITTPMKTPSWSVLVAG